MAKFQTWSKLCKHVGKGCANDFPKFQVHKFCGSQDIYIQNCASFWREDLRFLDSKYSTGWWCSLYLALDWPVTIYHCSGERKGLPVDEDWQVVVNSNASQWIHPRIDQLRATLSLALAPNIIISVEVWRHQPSTLNQNILVTFVFQF